MSSGTVVVIGGGVIGLSTAYQLARKQAGRVVLLDKGSLGDGASSRAAGIGTHLVWSETGLRARQIGFRLFRQFSEEWDDYTFHHEHGCLNLFTPEAWPERAALLPLYNRLNVAFEVLDANEIRSRWPALNPPDDYVGLHDPRGGYSEPDEYIAALAKRVNQLGVEVLEQEPVVGFPQSGSRVVGVRTPRNSIEADAVVSTVNVWSLPLWRELQPASVKARQFAPDGAVDDSATELRERSETQRMVTPHSRLSAASGSRALHSVISPVGLRLPMKHFVHQRYLTIPLSQPFVAPPVNANPYFGYIRPAAGNRVLMGLETANRAEFRVESCNFRMNKMSTPTAVRDQGRERFKSLAPVLNNVTWESEQIGLISFTSDGEPVLGPVQQLPGLYVAASFHSGGFSYNTVAGLLMAELVMDGRACIDLSAFSPDRFNPAETELHLAATVPQHRAVRRRH